jgi:hypothetical protein
MKRRIGQAIATAAAIAVTATVVIGFAGTGSAVPGASQVKACTVPGPLQVFAITSDGQVMASFMTNTPQRLDWVRNPEGLITDTALIGLDFRVQDGKLYVVGNHGGIYTVTITGDNPERVILTKVSQLTVPLHGTTFGVDFNPAADRLRVISDTGQNLRHDLNSHTTVADALLSAGPGSPALSGVTAAAYTNNDLNSSTATTLFDINTLTDQVVIQSPANNGFLTPTGALGPAVAANAGFDIFSDLDGGRTVSNTGFAALVPSSTGRATFHTVDMLTGTATAVGQFPLQITGIAVQLDS